MNVPFELPRSFTVTPVVLGTSSAWRREIVGSKIGMSLVTARPTIYAFLAERSKS
jgi:hypothetical protein